ncbi:MAG: DeoR/GlpR family DNA-binding transcription regulator [Acutalibacteraceae bacterium]
MAKRIDEIKQKVEAEGEVFVSELSRLYNVTEETIRRDLEKLKNDGVVTRTYGGAMLNTVLQNDQIHFSKRRAINLEGKKRIAELFLREYGYIRTVMVDNSTTAIEAIKLLKDDNDITVISFSAQIFQELDDTNMTLVSTGGIYNERARSFYGSLAKESIRKYNVDLALLGCKGLDMTNGISDSLEGEANLKAEMSRRAARVVVLADHSKFGQTAFVNFINWDMVDCIITDQRPDGKWEEFCSRMNIRLIYE